jgi:HAD superfamily hydrolase (TIGR01509 family)
MTDAVLFDWDGTLLDSRQALLSAWHAASEEVVGRRFPSTAEEERLVFTQPGSRVFPQATGDTERAERLAAAFQEAYETSGRLVRAFPGVEDVLTRLREAEVGVGVVTSKARHRYELDADRIGVAELVDVAVCQEDCPVHKPDPAPVMRALERLGVAAGSAVMVGDTPVDLAAGAAAGTGMIGVGWGASGAEALRAAGAGAVAASAAELTELLLHAGCRSEMIAS